MKISKSKQELARIISENGGWCDGEFAAQDGDGTGSIDFFKSKPQYYPNSKFWRGVYDPSERIARADVTIKNFHQTILSRDEYFRMYPAQDVELVAMRADVTKENKHPEYCESVMRTIPEPSDKPTIEQLAADYKAKLEIAQQAQEEADSRRGEAEAALEKLYNAGLEIGLDIAIASDEDGEPEIVITDWRDLQLGDVVWISECKTLPAGEYEVLDTDCDARQPIKIKWNCTTWWPDLTEREWRFMRRM